MSDKRNEILASVISGAPRSDHGGPGDRGPVEGGPLTALPTGPPTSGGPGGGRGSHTTLYRRRGSVRRRTQGDGSGGKGKQFCAGVMLMVGGALQ